MSKYYKETINMPMQGKIDAIARESREDFNSEGYTRGIMVANVWYNLMNADKATLDQLVSYLSKGDTISFEIEGKYMKDVAILEKAPKQTKDFDTGANFETLLSDAHGKGLVGIISEIISIDTEKQIAIFKATVTMKEKDGTLKTYTAHGDAIPGLKVEYTDLKGTKKIAENMQSGNIKPHYIRMAETRAIVRALRLATNNAETAEEEIGSEVEKK